MALEQKLITTPHDVMAPHARNVPLTGESLKKDDWLDVPTLAAGQDRFAVAVSGETERETQADLDLPVS